jgi:hypothetical protein
MPAYPFTPAGIASKQADLYLLDDTDLLIAARSIADDVETWLNANFILTAKQVAYISAAPPTVKFSWGTSIAAAVIGRGVIIVDPVPNYGPPRRTKEIIFEPDGDSKYFPPVTGIGALTGSPFLKVRFVLVD